MSGEPYGNRRSAWAAQGGAESPGLVDVEALLLRMLGIDGRESSLVAKIALSVGRDIIEGVLLEGADVSSAALADRFGTSRTPVREALLVLERQGLVDIPPRRRPRVASFESVLVREIYELRAVLVGFAAASVCERVTDEELKLLHERLLSMRQAAKRGRVHEYFWANVHYNELVSELARNGTLRGTMDSLGLRTLRLRYRSISQTSRMNRSMADHDRLFVAYQERNGRLAAALAETIVHDAYRALSREE